MTRKVKALALALMAVFVVSAATATGASAVKFTASSYAASIAGGQTATHVFTVQGQTVTCKFANFTGTLLGATEEIAITPSYGECTAFGFVNASVAPNGCTFELTTGLGGSGSMHINCPAGKSIVVNGGSCTVHIPEQTPTTNIVDYANSGGGIMVSSTLEGIHSSVTKGSFLCPLSNATTDSTGKYTGSTLLKGTGGETLDIG